MTRRYPAALDPDGVARAIVTIAEGEEHGDRNRCFGWLPIRASIELAMSWL